MTVPAISPRARIAAAAGIVALVAVGSSVASFSDPGDVQTTITAGTLDLKFDDDQDGNPTPYVIDFSDGAGAMAPGVSVTYDLTVFNSGSIAAVGSLGTPEISSSDPAAPVALQDALSLGITDADSVLYDGPLTTAAFSGLDLPAGGSRAEGPVLTLTLTMSTDAPVQVAGQSVTIALPFTATQA